MRLSTVLYGAMQIVVFCATAWLIVSAAQAQGHAIAGIGVWLVSLAVTAIATAIVYWSIEGIKRLLGKPPSPPIVPPKGAFDNLRSRPPTDEPARLRKS
jgi:hypothetical protein